MWKNNFEKKSVFKSVFNRGNKNVRRCCFSCCQHSRRAGEGFDEIKIHSFDQAGACHINGLLPLGIVLRLANHWEDFQHLTFDQLFGQLTVVWVQHVVDNHKAAMLYPRVVVKTQPLQDLKPLAGLLGEISQSVSRGVKNAKWCFSHLVGYLLWFYAWPSDQLKKCLGSGGALTRESKISTNDSC